MPTCKGCGAKIEWITVKAARIPLDSRRHPIYMPDGVGWVRVDAARISHFATCPDANRFSKQAAQRRETRVAKPKEPSHDDPNH